MDGAYKVNLGKHKPIETHWVALLNVNDNGATYFDRCGVEHIPGEIKHLLKTKILYEIFTGCKSINQ